MTTFGVLVLPESAVDLVAAPGDAVDAEPQPAARSTLPARAASDSCAIVLAGEAPRGALPPSVNLREATTKDWLAPRHLKS